ncbi:MAG: hypothetical protein J6Y00_02725 [Paludibacteraceae bacterium]|nr:hypothetical protein [Paludibacteraceae bacterium]
MKKNYSMPKVGIIALQAGERLMWELESSLDKDDPNNRLAPQRRTDGGVPFRSLRLQW